MTRAQKSWREAYLLAVECAKVERKRQRVVGTVISGRWYYVVRLGGAA